MDEWKSGRSSVPSSSRPLVLSSIPPFFHSSTLFILLGLLLMAPGCGSNSVGPDDEEPAPEPLLNLAHLDHLGQDVVKNGVTYRLIHIYAEAPDYAWVGDDDEGISALDDVARAAVVYLRHFETTGDTASREKAEKLLRFAMYMQKDDGLFYNFVWNDQLDINTTHQNSRADAFEWWAARGVWAMGMGARVLKDANPAFSQALAERIRRTYPHLEKLLTAHGRTTTRGGRTYPQWLIHEFAADATSELLLGLVALNKAYPDAALKTMIDRFAEGIAMMQWGAANTFPYGAHASWVEEWHGWGNSQTQALAEAGHIASAQREAHHFYPRLLIDGWLHSINLSTRGTRPFEQIAYATRAVTVGLIRLFEATGETRYAQMAGLAASWFTGNNVAGVAMYAPAHGYGYDGIGGPDAVNYNAGAESTIEANFSLLEVERHPEARRWLTAKGAPPVRVEKGGKQYAYRVFTNDRDERLGLALNLTDETLELLEGEALTAFLDGQ